jgi:hypothetical protein
MPLDGSDRSVAESGHRAINPDLGHYLAANTFVGSTGCHPLKVAVPPYT